MNIQWNDNRVFGNSIKLYGQKQEDKTKKGNSLEGLNEKEQEKFFYQEQVRHNTKQKAENEYLNSLSEKVKNGEPLTPAERETLKAKNPILYKESEEIAKEIKEYKQSIKDAKTDEELEDIKLHTVGKFSKELKSVVNNPNISGSKKRELAELITKKLLGIEKETKNKEKSKSTIDLQI